MSITLGGDDVRYLEQSGYDQAGRLFFAGPGQERIALPNSAKWMLRYTLSRRDSVPGPGRTRSGASGRTSLLSTSRTARGFALSVLTISVGAGILNTLIAAAARALGADTAAVPGLTPPAYLTFTVIGTVLGTVGWSVVRRYAASPSRGSIGMLPRPPGRDGAYLFRVSYKSLRK